MPPEPHPPPHPLRFWRVGEQVITRTPTARCGVRVKALGVGGLGSNRSTVGALIFFEHEEGEPPPEQPEKGSERSNSIVKMQIGRLPFDEFGQIFREEIAF